MEPKAGSYSVIVKGKMVSKSIQNSLMVTLQVVKPEEREKRRKAKAAGVILNPMVECKS